MRIETVEIKLYKFEELQESARETVKRELFNGVRDTDIFYEGFKFDLQELFPNSSLDLQFSFSCCQGDGVNVYGTLVLSDMAKIILKSLEQYTEKKNLSEKELNRYRRFLNNVTHENGFCNIKLESNGRYTYSLKTQSNFVESTKEDIINNIFEYWIEIDEKTDKIITVFAENIQEYFSSYEKQIEDAGNEYFLQDIPDDEMQEYCDANEYEFTVDGKIY